MFVWTAKKRLKGNPGGHLPAPRGRQILPVALVCLLWIPAAQAASAELESQLTALKKQELALAESLIQAVPQSEEPLVIMGNIHSGHGNTDKAMALWSQAVQKNPMRVDVYHKMAEVAFQMDRMEEAIALWRKVLERDPQIRGAHVKIAEALMNLGDYEQCITEAQKEVEIDGRESVESAILLGRAYQNLQKYELARQHYERVIEQDPDHLNAHYGLYNVCMRLKDRTAAQEAMKQYRAIKAEQQDDLRQYEEALPSDMDCFYQNLAKFCFDTRSFYRQTPGDSHVEAALMQGIALGQSNPAFLKRMAELYVSAGNTREALGLYGRLAQLTPDDTACYAKIGILSVQLGMLDIAEKAFGEVITRDPEEAVGYQELSQLYVRMKKNLPEARQMAEKAVQLQPSAPAYHDLALACIANQDLEAAVTAMERAVQLDPRDPRYARALALVKQRKGEVQ